MEKLFDIKKTQLQMMIDRGFVVSPDEQRILNMSINEFADYATNLTVQAKRSLRSALTRVYDGPLNQNGIPSKRAIVYYAAKDQQKKQVSADIVRDFINLINYYKCTDAILIVDAPLSSTANNSLQELRLVRTQVFFDDQLTYNPTLHVDTPRHVLLSPEETRTKLQEMKVELSKLPLISEKDPVVRYYGWQAGGLVCIYRDDRSISILTPKSITYRVIT